MVPWPSSGWTNDRNVTQMLEFLMMRGEIAITGRVGRQRVWDLAERVYPADTPVVAGRRGPSHQERTTSALAGHRPREGHGGPGRAEHRGRCRRAGDGRGRARNVARGPRGARQAVRRTDRVVVALRSPALRPQARHRAVRLRVRARDVQARGQAPVGLLRASDPPPRPAGGQAGRHRRSQDLDATRARRPPGHPVHRRDDRRRRRRARGTGVVARPGVGRARAEP